MTKSHREYAFGTFSERLAHACALFEAEPPELEYKDGGLQLTDALQAWINTHEINMDWLLSGSPDSLLRFWSEHRIRSRETANTVTLLEPPIRRGFIAMLHSVVNHGVPIDEAIGAMDQVIAEFRASQAEVVA